MVFCFIPFLFQKENFALYALYSKNKPQSDALFISHGQSFFKVRFQGVASVYTTGKSFFFKNGSQIITKTHM